MLIWLSSTNYRTEFWFGLVWYGFSILIWFGGSPALLASLSPPLPPTNSTILHTTDDGWTRKKNPNGVGYRVAAQLKKIRLFSVEKAIRGSPSAVQRRVSVFSY